MDQKDKFQPLITSIDEGKIARVALEFIQNELSRLYDQVDSKIFKKIKDGEEISYEEMVLAFSEKYSYKCLMKAMRQSSRKGESSGNKFKKLTEGGENGKR